MRNFMKPWWEERERELDRKIIWEGLEKVVLVENVNMHENSIWLGFAIPEGCAVRTIDIGQSANTILSCYIILHDTNCSIAYPKSSLSLSMIILHWSFSHESRHIVIVCGARILNIELHRHKF